MSERNNNLNPLLKVKEAEAKEAEAKEFAKELEAVTPATINSVAKQIKEGEIRCVLNEESEFEGVNGGKYYQRPIQTLDGRLITVCGKNRDEVDVIIKRCEEEGIEGDGKLHKLVYINTNGELVEDGGMPCDCVGETVAELHADIKAAQKTAKANGKYLFTRVYQANTYFDAKKEIDNLEEVIASDDQLYVLDYEEKVVRDVNFEKVADLDDLSSDLNKDDIKKLLISRLEDYVEILEDEEEDYYDDDYDEE